MPGSVLLSHGETPHYHRRYAFSLEFGMESGGTRIAMAARQLAAWIKNHPDELGSDKDGATEVPAHQSSWVLYDQASRAISTG